MFQLIKTDKWDKCFGRLFTATYLAYVSLIMLVDTALMDIVVIGKGITYSIRCTFVLVFLVSLYNLFRGKYTLKEILIGFIIFVPVIISMFVSKSAAAFMAFVYIYAAKGINVEKIVKYTLITITITYAIVVLSRVFGITDEHIYHSVKHGLMRDRYSFGFNYTCVGTIYYLFMTIFYIYIRKDKFNYIDAIFIMVVNAVLYMLTFTLNNFVFVLLAILLAFYVKYCRVKTLNEVFSYLTILSPVIGTIIIYLLTKLYASGNKLGIIINRFTSGRLSLTNNAINNYGIHLFGSSVEFIGGPATGTAEYNYVDSFYMQYLIQFGIIVFIIIIAVLVYLAYKAYKNNSKWLLFSFFIINYHAVFDDKLFGITLNPFLLLFLVYLSIIVNEKSEA